MNGYMLGLIVEGVIGIFLIIAILIVSARIRKNASRDRVVNGIGGYLVHVPDENEEISRQPGAARLQAITDPSDYGEQNVQPFIWEIGPERDQNANRAMENFAPSQTEFSHWQNWDRASSWPETNHALVGQWPGHEPDVADENTVRFQTAEKTFADAYAELSAEQKKFFSDILRYALSKPRAEQKMSKTGICVKSAGKVILKLKVRRKMTVALFRLENDRLRDYRRNTNNASAIRQKETEIYVQDESTKDTACGMVDLMLEQYAKERQEAKERRRALRAKRRAEQQVLKESASASEDTDRP